MSTNIAWQGSQQYVNSLAKQRALLKSTQPKYFDIQGTEQVITAYTQTPNDGSPAYSLFSPAEGTTLNTRTGRRCLVHSVKIHLKHTIEESSTAIFEQTDSIPLRLILMVDTQSNGTIPTGVFETGDTDSFKSLKKGMRYKVLMDKWIATPKTMGITKGSFFHRAPPIEMHTFNYTFKEPLLVTFASSNAGHGEIVDNNIFAWIAAQDGDEMRVTTYTRVCFTDA